jgi:hypothetical protein
MNEPSVLREQPAPEVKTEVVSEVTFTKDELVELVRAHYGAGVVPHVKVEADAIFGCGELCQLKFAWTMPFDFVSSLPASQGERDPVPSP